MKNIIKSTLFLNIILFFLISCNNYNYKDFKIEDNLWLFANDIINNPNQLYRIKDFYPEIYNDSVFFSKMNDSNYIKGLITFIVNDFNVIKKKSEIRIQGYYFENVDNIRNNNRYNNVHLKDLYGFNLQKEDIGVSFNFIKIKNSYYLLYITNYKMSKL